MNKKKYSSTQERRMAATNRGDTQLGSGCINRATMKADVKNRRSREWKILIEGKTTVCDSHQEGVRSKSVKKDWLQTVEQQAQEGGYDLGVLAFSFDNRTDYYVLKDRDFNNMYQALLDYEVLVEQLKEQIAALQNQNQGVL